MTVASVGVSYVLSRSSTALNLSNLPQAHQFSSVQGLPNEDEWCSEGVQVGGAGSTAGILGLWTGAEHEPGDPLGASVCPSSQCRPAHVAVVRCLVAMAGGVKDRSLLDTYALWLRPRWDSFRWTFKNVPATMALRCRLGHRILDRRCRSAPSSYCISYRELAFESHRRQNYT